MSCGANFLVPIRVSWVLMDDKVKLFLLALSKNFVLLITVVVLVVGGGTLK